MQSVRSPCREAGLRARATFKWQARLMFSYAHLDELRRAEIDEIVSLFPSRARVLEVGAGSGRQARELERRGFQVTAVELPDSNYAAHRVFPIVDYDGATIPLPDASVDVVFSSNVLEHVPDLARLHAEIRRVLAPGGCCVHVLPTHTWRLWTTLTSYLEAISFFVSSLPQLVPRARPSGAELRRLRQAWYRTIRHTVGLCLPRRHGERGNVITELWLFHPGWWRQSFRAHGFAVVNEAPVGLFYTGEMLLGSRLGLAGRKRLARVLGSSCHVFKLVPVPDGADGTVGQPNSRAMSAGGRPATS